MVYKLHSIAVWLGFHSTELELDEYLSTEFSDDFGIQFESHDIPEYHVNVGSEVRVQELISHFTYSEAIMAEVLKKCEIQGWETAQSALFFFGVEYYEKDIQNPIAPLSFIGNFIAV